MYPHQAERLALALEGLGADALVATAPANVAYVAGAPAGTAGREVFAVATRDRTALAAPAAGPSPITDADVVCEGGTGFDALGEALTRLGVTRGRLGIDDTALAAARRAELTTRLAAFSLVPASEALALARQVKGPWEIECLQRALHAAEQALAVALDAVRPGASEREVVRAFQAEAARHDATPHRTIVAFGDRVAPAATDRPLRPGDVVRLEVGCVVRGYHSLVTRTAVMGEPTTDQQARFDAVHAGVEAALSALRPGVAAEAVVQAALTAARKAGLADLTRMEAAHGIGLEVVERPALHDGGPALEAGMVLVVGLASPARGEGAFTVKETVLVSRGGSLTLNRSHRGLLVLD